MLVTAEQTFRTGKSKILDFITVRVKEYKGKPARWSVHPFTKKHVAMPAKDAKKVLKTTPTNKFKQWCQANVK